MTQRLRWIPAGSFHMGSPEDESGRFDDEGPQHLVTISHGFWLFETPCTQAFWTAAMGKNPSRFQGADRPVEQVSWNDCQMFCEQLAQQFPGYEVSLPTEAEWEYACRAGTTTATYAGDLTMKADKAAELEGVAWFWGNSGRQTHVVGETRRNPWGLCDMLGNVHEWCQDGRREYSNKAVIDPVGPLASADRVFRGGCWDSGARGVRAAFRSWDSRDDRGDRLGFRCRVRELQPAREGGASVERRSGRAEPRGDSETTSGDRAGEAPVGLVPGQPGRSQWVNLIERDSDRAPLPPGPAMRIVTDVEELTLRQITKPAWASAIGRDRFGLWCEFKVPAKIPAAVGDVVKQRLRWIPPGRFQMGSPKDEPGRNADWEFEPKTVVVNQGFWLFDTTCTQALWEAVMGDNPSNFRSPTRPVEQVSWDDCQRFCQRFGERMGTPLPGLALKLPSETEWEYACRAGTETASYAGPVQIMGERDAPILDEIAWYCGNSGVSFELDNGWDASSWTEKQHEFQTAGTHPVAGKKPNGWGLFDMLGNVYERCDNVWHKPGDEPTAGQEGASAVRVFRGGGWLSGARYVRAAYRNWCSPDRRDDYLGFRCRVR